MADLDHEARVEAVRVQMFNHLRQALLGEQLTGATLQMAREIVAFHVEKGRKNGVAMPELAIMAFPKQGGLEVVNRDMDLNGIRITILNLTAKYPRITAAEIAEAVRAIWPDVRSLDLVRHKPGVG